MQNYGIYSCICHFFFVTLRTELIFMIMQQQTDIIKPFDPSQLKVEVKNTTINSLCEMLEHEMIDLQPDFQRHANLWDHRKKSRFIESLILGIPIPSIFMYVDYSRKKWVVIDGLQRLCALSDFMVTKHMRLHGMELLTGYEDYSFDDFPYFEQLDMTMRNITINIISGEASLDAIYIIFKRLNSEGVALKPAEIRNALYHGPAMDLVKEIADGIEFQNVIDGAVSTRRLMHHDYVSRFIAFYLKDYREYRGNMDLFLRETLSYLNEAKDQNVFVELKEAFSRSLNICVTLLGKDVFRSPIMTDKKKESNPMSITLFETMMCSVAKLTVDQENHLLRNIGLYRDMYVSLFKDPQLVKYLSQGTGQPASVRYRFERMGGIVKKIVL